MTSPVSHFAASAIESVPLLTIEASLPSLSTSGSTSPQSLTVSIDAGAKIMELARRAAQRRKLKSMDSSPRLGLDDRIQIGCVAILELLKSNPGATEEELVYRATDRILVECRRDRLDGILEVGVGSLADLEGSKNDA